MHTMRSTTKASTTAAPAVAVAPPEPKDQRHGAALTAKFIRAIGRATKEEKSFLHSLLDEWNKGMFSIEELAADAGLNALGVYLPGDPNEIATRSVELAEAAWVSVVSGRANKALRSMLRIHADFRERGREMTLEDMLLQIEEEIQEQEVIIENARDALRHSPAALRAEIRAAVREHPELLEEANAR
jgi:hypothetical protein